jgi:hypothetical protein
MYINAHILQILIYVLSRKGRCLSGKKIKEDQKTVPKNIHTQFANIHLKIIIQLMGTTWNKRLQKKKE